MHFVTFSCYRRRAFFDDAALRDEFAENIEHARALHRFRLLAWVVMPEHVHVMLMPTCLLDEQGSALPAILMAIKKPFSQAVMARWRARGLAKDVPRFWQAGGGFDRNVRDFAEFAREVQYTHQNPVERGLVANAVDWKWSSARWFAGKPALLNVDACTVFGRAFPGPDPTAFLGG